MLKTLVFRRANTTEIGLIAVEDESAKIRQVI